MIDAIASLLAAPAGVSTAAPDGTSATADAGPLFASALAAAGAEGLLAAVAASAALPLPMTGGNGDPLHPDIGTPPQADGHTAAPDGLGALLDTLGGAEAGAATDAETVPGATAPGPSALLTALAHTERAKAKQAADAIDRALAHWIDQLPAMPFPEPTAAEAVVLEADTLPGTEEEDTVFGDDARAAELFGLALPPTALPAATRPRADSPLAAAPIAPIDDKWALRSVDGRGDLKTPGRSGPTDRRAAAPRAEAPPSDIAAAPLRPAVGIGSLPTAETAPAGTPPTTPAPRSVPESPSPAALPTPPGPAASSPPNSAAAAPSSASAFQAQLSAAIDSPAFGAALGIQISTLVDNGITEARLHLNPAEFGPIAVQIGLDGAQAQVHMAVEHAHTRQTLEQALPELVQALRDAGFTMTGGGVSQQPRDGTPGAPPGGSALPAVNEAAQGAIAPEPAARRLQGMVDLYA